MGSFDGVGSETGWAAGAVTAGVGTNTAAGWRSGAFSRGAGALCSNESSLSPAPAMAFVFTLGLRTRGAAAARFVFLGLEATALAEDDESSSVLRGRTMSKGIFKQQVERIPQHKAGLR